MMRTSIVFLMVIAVGWCFPRKLDQPEQRLGNRTPVIVREFPDLHVQVTINEDDKYGLEVYKANGSERLQIPTKAWKVPKDWKAPGRNTSRIIHAELLSDGEVVVVLYSPATGLDLIVLPLTILEVSNGTTASPPYRAISFPNQPIHFPNFTVPWHPTVSTPAEGWAWEPADAELVTPSSRIFPVPEKTSAA